MPRAVIRRWAAWKGALNMHEPAKKHCRRRTGAVYKQDHCWSWRRSNKTWLHELLVHCSWSPNSVRSSFVHCNPSTISVSFSRLYGRRLTVACTGRSSFETKTPCLTKFAIFITLYCRTRFTWPSSSLQFRDYKPPFFSAFCTSLVEQTSSYSSCSLSVRYIDHYHPALLYCRALILDRLLTFLTAFFTFVLKPSFSKSLKVFSSIAIHLFAQARLLEFDHSVFGSHWRWHCAAD